MLTSGGDPLQLTSDPGQKLVDSFSTDGTQIYYRKGFASGEVWAVPTLGGGANRLVSGGLLIPSSDGNSVYFTRNSQRGIFRANKSGMSEELLYTWDANAWPPRRLLAYPEGKRLLVLTTNPTSALEMFHIYSFDLTAKTAQDLGDAPGLPDQTVWSEPGKSILLVRTVNGLTNLWKYDLADKTFTQISFGPGPDIAGMPDPAGRGMFMVHGKDADILTVYNARTKETKDLAGENATQPALSHDARKVMYITNPSRDRTELWVADTDGNSKRKLAEATGIATGNWSRDDRFLAFSADEPGKVTKAYLVAPDGSGLRTLTWSGAELQAVIVGADSETVFLNAFEKGIGSTIWMESAEGSAPEKLVERCGFAFDVAPGGGYLFAINNAPEKKGIYEVSLADRKCTLLVPGVSTFGLAVANDGKSILYAVPSQRDVTIYRQNWQPGKAIGQPQVMLKLPFSFPLVSGGNAYDFSRDLSTVAYVRPGGQPELYFLGEK